MLKKVLSLFLLLSISALLFACGNKKNSASTTTEETTTTTQNGDKIPPAFIGAVDGKLEGVSHLKGEEINILDDVTARDNITSSNVTVTIIDYDGYDNTVPGVYTITIQAEDEAGNKSTVTKEVTVLDTLERTLSAILIGDDFTEYVYNDTNALTYTTSGTAFRMYDYVQVMTKDFFVTEYNEHKAEHTYNALIPFFPNGVIVITDNDFNVKLVRIAAGAILEISADNQVKTEGLTWTNTIDAANGGGNFKGIIETLESVIPDGGYIMFTGNAPDETGRKFLIRNFFYTGYAGGAITAEQFDVNVTELEIELDEDYKEIIAVPDKIPAPVLSVNRHVLSWEAIPNAKEYEIYVDGELKETITATTYALANLELQLTPEGEAGYSITVKAITKDMFQWSTSDLSEPVIYKQIEIQPLTAPVVSVDGTTVTWDLVTGAASYDVYISYAGKNVKLGNTTESTFDLASFAAEYVGYVNVYVKGIGDNEHYDSDNSNAEQVFLGEVESFTVGGQTVDVVRTTAYNYFIRRNTDYALDKTGFANAPFIFLITDIYNIKNANFGANATEAFSTVVVLDSEGKPKLINNILGKQTWKLGEGWITDDTYANNGAQLSNVANILAEADMLLIGKNGSTVTVTFTDQTTKAVKARDFVAYHYVNPWTNYEGTEGWRSFPNFIDPTNVTYEITQK